MTEYRFYVNADGYRKEIEHMFRLMRKRKISECNYCDNLRKMAKNYCFMECVSSQTNQ